MRRPVRVALVVVGLSAVVYSTASLTGGWLGTPPWWERSSPLTEAEWNRRYYVEAYRKRGGPGLPTMGDPLMDMMSAGQGASSPDAPWFLARLEAPRHVEPRPGREWISGGVVAVGLGLVAVGAWPRRRRETAP